MPARLLTSLSSSSDTLYVVDFFTSLLWLSSPSVSSRAARVLTHSLSHRWQQQQQQHYSPNQDLFLLFFFIQKSGQVSVEQCLWGPHCLTHPAEGQADIAREQICTQGGTKCVLMAL